jgi:hypothetical protein
VTSAAEDWLVRNGFASDGQDWYNDHREHLEGMLTDEGFRPRASILKGIGDAVACRTLAIFADHSMIVQVGECWDVTDARGFCGFGRVIP